MSPSTGPSPSVTVAQRRSTGTQSPTWGTPTNHIAVAPHLAAMAQRDRGVAMATSLTYPGVYLVETANVPLTVTPATTNDTAFIGAFPKGSVDEAVVVGSFDEFESQFGALDADSTMAAYGVYQFFLNG